MTEDQKLEQYQDIIDKLHEGLELTEIENSIVKSDDDFKKYQNNHLQIEQAITHNAMEKKLSELNELEKKYKSEPKRKRGLSRRSYLLLAASSILLLLAYFFVNSGDDAYDGDFLAHDSVMDFTDPETTRSSINSDTKNPYAQYSSGKYRMAISTYKELIATDDNPKHKFFYGVCLLREGKWKEAETVFENEELKALRNYPLNYNLAVAKIGLEKTDEALDLLSNPSSGNELFNREAEKLRNKIQGRLDR